MAYHGNSFGKYGYSSVVVDAAETRAAAMNAITVLAAVSVVVLVVSGWLTYWGGTIKNP